jgi:hypothetical protein
VCEKCSCVGYVDCPGAEVKKQQHRLGLDTAQSCVAGRRLPVTATQLLTQVRT